MYELATLHKHENGCVCSNVNVCVHGLEEEEENATTTKSESHARTPGEIQQR